MNWDSSLAYGKIIQKPGTGEKAISEFGGACFKASVPSAQQEQEEGISEVAESLIMLAAFLKQCSV